MWKLILLILAGLYTLNPYDIIPTAVSNTSVAGIIPGSADRIQKINFPKIPLNGNGIHTAYWELAEAHPLKR